MKKLISIVLTLSLILSFSIPAFADTEVNFAEGADTRIYNGYKLLNLTTGLKGEAHHPKECDGTNHSDDCYNYAYTVNVKYRAILQAETLENGGNDLWGSGVKPTNPEKVTDEQILQYFVDQTSDNGVDYGTLRRVADRIYREIQAAGIEADGEEMQGHKNVIGDGYWLIADVTDLDGKDAANSLVMLDTKGEQEITVNPKLATPEFEKKVKDIENSEDENINDNPWQDAADHDIDDEVPFKLTGTLPSNARAYESFEMIFHDTMDTGLTLIEKSIKVLMYETKYKADVDTDLNDGQDVTEYFTKKFDDIEDGCTFEVSCENVFETGATKDTAFVVYYEATLNNNAAIGSEGNYNTAYLEYSNNPYGEGTGKSIEDKVAVYTYQITVNKTDSHGHALEGAGFTLYKKDINGVYNSIGNELKGENLTIFEWKGLDDGDYKLVETTVPEGYNKMSDIVFSISASHSETADEPKLLLLDGGQLGTGVVDTGIISKDIVNHTGTVLPETGAKGTMMLLMGGGLLVAFAAVFMITRKKMSIYED